MRRLLFLHVGVHRTATTLIQSYLAQNQAALMQRGVMPGLGRGRHAGLVNAIFQGSRNVADVAQELNGAADASGDDIRSIILSDEDICTRRDLTRLAGFLDSFDVKVVLSLRRQDLWLESWYQQNVKWQWNKALAHLTFSEFAARRHEFFWIDYDRTLTHLEDLFGAGNILCRVFEQQQMPQGPVTDFLQTLGLPRLAEEAAGLPRENGRLSPLTTELMRVLPLDRLPEAERRFLERAFLIADEAVQKRTGPQSALLMDHGDRVALMSDYAAGNAAVAVRLFQNETLFTDPLPAEDAPLAPRNLPNGSYATVETLVAPLIEALASVWGEDVRRLRHDGG